METLKKRSEFLAVAKGGRVGRRAFVLQGLKRSTYEPARIGYTVTKKTGNSVVRSRIKRRLRAAVAELRKEDIPLMADFVLIGRREALSEPFTRLVSEIRAGLPISLVPGAGQKKKTRINGNQRKKNTVAAHKKQG